MATYRVSSACSFYRSIKRHVPIRRPKSPLHQFSEEVKLARSEIKAGQTSYLAKELPFDIMRSRVMDMWKSLDPEMKKKYFCLSEIDRLRFQREYTTFLAQLGQLLAKNDFNTEKTIEYIKKLPGDYFESQSNIDTVKFNFEENLNHLVKARTLENFIRDQKHKLPVSPKKKALEALGISEAAGDLDEKPVKPFLMYAQDNSERIVKIKNADGSKYAWLRYASIEWSKESEEVKDRYKKLYAEKFQKAKSEISHQPLPKIELDNAKLERTKYRKSLNENLKSCSVKPKGYRNSFSWFMMANSTDKDGDKDFHFTKMTKLWYDLPATEKAKYRELREKDCVRYYAERDKRTQMILEIIDHIKGRSENDDNSEQKSQTI